MAKKRERTRLEKLMHSWGKASIDERRQFIGWLGLDGPQPTPAPIATGRYLTPEVIARIEQILAVRRIGIAEVMAELGFDRRDPSLLRAMARRASLRLVVIAALENWLRDHAGLALP